MFLYGLLYEFDNEPERTCKIRVMIIFVGYLLLVLNVLLRRKKKPDAGILISYDDDDFSQGNGQINRLLELE